LATQLLDKSTILECTRQFWATINYDNIIPKIFDQFSRYNLATIDYHPVLKDANLHTPYITDDQPPVEIDFSRGDFLGGRLAVKFTTVEGKTYTVDRDIIILPFGEFIVSPGTRLEFKNALGKPQSHLFKFYFTKDFSSGLYVEGFVDFNGNELNQIVMELGEEPAVVNHTSVRLMDGPDEFEGRLEVRPEGEEEWGTVCSKVRH
jgi:hypothetical protein